MTAPEISAADQELLSLLGLVDVSRARATASEDQFRSDIAALYASRYQQLESEDSSGVEVLDAIILSGLVLLIRRAFAAGVDEGARFAFEQFGTLGVSPEIIGSVDFSNTEIPDKLVKDFLTGQVEVVKSVKDRQAMFQELARRGDLAAVSAFQSGRGWATVEAFDALTEVLSGSLHKLWVARFDLVNPPCPMCTRLHGHHVPLGQAFAVPDAEPTPYFSPLQAPPRHPNCRCSLVLYLPDAMKPDADVTPLSMQAYGEWKLAQSQQDEADYIAATIVHVKAYTRMVDGQLQQVSGYYYNVQTGQKIPEGSYSGGQSVKTVTAKQAKSMAQVSKTAKKAAKPGEPGKSKWSPGTYKVDLPNAPDDTQVIVHKDGSSTSIHKGQTEDADPAKTTQFLSLYDGYGVVSKISDDDDAPDPKGPGPKLEPDEKAKKDATLAEGFYLIPDHPSYGGVKVDHDGTGTLYFKDFKKTIPLKEVAIKQLSNGNLGELHEVEEENFTEDWYKQYKSSQAGGATPGPDKDAPDLDTDKAPSSAKQTLAPDPDAAVPANPPPTEKAKAPKPEDQPELPEAPEGGPGGVVQDAPSLFSVGEHSVEIPEGSQVYKSGKSKDTLYVLQSNGDLIKYNPQGAGVQATVVGSSENPAARAQLLASLNNVSDEGVSIKNSMPTPGSGKALVGGFELTSAQLGDAIKVLSSNPSGNVAADLKKIGSPLAGGKFHEVAAPHKAYFNNKTKPALIQALKNAQAKTGTTPVANLAPVAHLEKEHGLEEHQAQLGHTDVEAIHDALHAIDPKGSDHQHEPASPGFISFNGVPVTPQAVSEALSALQQSPAKETGVKKPLKSIGSPLTGLDLQELVNNSSVTEQYKGSNGKVHYGKMKPAVQALLQNALDKHQTSNPPVSKPAAVVPEKLINVEGISATVAEIEELQSFFASFDMDTDNSWAKELQKLTHNPLSQHGGWLDSADEFSGSLVSPHELNATLHDYLNSYLPKPNPYTPNVTKPVPQEDTSTPVSFDIMHTTVDKMKAYQAALAKGTVNDLPGSNDFQGISDDFAAEILGVYPGTPNLKQAISDKIQEKIDQATFVKNHPPVAEVPSAPETLSVAGKSVTKQDLQDAIAAVKASSSTGVKGPLKEIDSPLAKADLKTYIEADPVSNPWKGSNGLVHYGKLKDAIVAVLEAKAEGMAAPGEAPKSEKPDITPVEDVPGPDVPVSEPDDYDFFNDATVTNADDSPSAKVEKAKKNAPLYPDLDDGTFADAFQQAMKNNTTWFYSEEDEIASGNHSEVKGSSYFSISPEGEVYYNPWDGPGKTVGDSQIVSFLGSQFQDPGGLDAALKDIENSPGVYKAAGGLQLTVYPDGSGLMVNLSSSQNASLDGDGVKGLLKSGAWDKLSDSIEDASPTVGTVEVGKYHVHGPEETVTVYPDGTAMVSSLYGESLIPMAEVAEQIQSLGSSPQSIELDLPDWMKTAEKDVNGFLIGNYTVEGGYESFTVTADGPDDISPYGLATLLLSGEAFFIPSSAKQPGEAPAGKSDKLKALVEKAKAAPMQDPWSKQTTNLSKGFQSSVKSGNTVYLTGGAGKNGVLSEGAPPKVQHYKFSPDGSIASVSGEGQVLKEYNDDQILAILDDAYVGPTVKDPEPPPAEGVSELAPDGTWEGYPLGVYTNGEGANLEITADGPQVDFDDDGLDADTVASMIDSGDLTLVPSQDSPVQSTPASTYDADSPKLSLVLPPGHIYLTQMDKGQLSNAVKQWVQESNLVGVAGLHMNAASKDQMANWLKHWANGEWDQAYAIEAAKVKNHKAKLTHPGSPDNPANAGGFQKKKLPPAVEGELPAGSPIPGDWPSITSYNAWTVDQADEYLLKANMQHPTGLHATKKKIWAQSHFNGDKYSTDSVSLHAKKNVEAGNHYSEPILPDVEKFDPGQAVLLPADFPEIDVSKKAAFDLTSAQADKYLAHVGSKSVSKLLMKQDLETKQAVISLHAAAAAGPDQKTFKDPSVAKKEMEDLLSKLGQQAAFIQQDDARELIRNVTDVTEKSFTKDKEQPYLEGSTVIYHVTDESGNPWLFKVGKSQHRVDIEDAAHSLSRLAGIPAATSILGTFEGENGQFQAKIPSQSTLKSVDPVDLPLSALKDLMGHHVQDYTTNNDDSVGRNFLLSPDGKRVYQIDIARAYAKFGETTSLELGHLSDWEYVYYEGIYSAILNGAISESDTDALYKASMKQAKKVASISGDDWEGVLRKGTALRPTYKGTTAVDQDDLVSQALDRKNGVADEFEEFWSDIYDRLGREKPSATSLVAENVYSGVSQDHLEAVAEAGHGGHSTFFGGTDLEDGHLLMQQVKDAKGGGDQLWMSGQLRDAADKRILAWLKDHVSSDISGLTSTQEPTLSQKSTQVKQAAGLGSAFDVILGAVKTVSHHHKNGDKDYNTQKMSALESLKSTVEGLQAQIDGGNYPSGITDVNKTNFANLVSFYGNQIAEVEGLKNGGGQSHTGQFKDTTFMLEPDPVTDPPVKKVAEAVKVELRQASYEAGSLDDSNNLVTTGEKKAGQSNGQRGKMFVATLPDGTEIEYRPHSTEYSIPLAQRGQLRVKVRKHDGAVSKADSAVQALQDMGLNMDAATDEDMELLYWRHLYGIMQSRSDRNKGNHKLVTEYVQANLPGGTEGTPALDAKEELERWREAWSRLAGKEKVTKWVDTQKYNPRFSHTNPQKPDLRAGQPWWNRFDADWEEIMNKPLPVRSSTGSGSMLQLVKGGNTWATEDRSKVLGKFIGGMSSGNNGGANDQDEGSSNFVFLRQFGAGANGQGKAPSGYGGASSYQFFYNPRIYARTSNYAYSSDRFGKLSARVTSANFSLSGTMTTPEELNSGNEVMFKHGLSFLDDVEMLRFSNMEAYQEALKYLKSLGITEIRGLPIEARIISPTEDVNAAYKKILEHLKTWRPEEEDM